MQDTETRTDLQRLIDWVQEQNARRLVPNFGNTQTSARASAQNGQLFSVDGCGTAIYMVTLSVTFEQFYPDEFK